MLYMYKVVSTFGSVDGIFSHFLIKATEQYLPVTCAVFQYFTEQNVSFVVFRFGTSLFLGVKEFH